MALFLFTSSYLLTTLVTDYCPKKCLTNISKERMPILNRTHRRPHYSSVLTSYKCYDSRLKVFKSRNNSCIGVTQENSIEFLIQINLPYILILMVRANYCAPCPKWPWVWHEANMCCPCCMMSLCSSTFYFLLLSPVIDLVTTPSSCDWCDSVTDQP